MDNWVIFIFGLVTGLYIKSFIHDFFIRIGFKILYGDKDINELVKQHKENDPVFKSKFQQRFDELKKAQENKTK